MKRAVLHIGTEKTGTTSTQRFLVNHLQSLQHQGILYPSSCNFLSNRNLILYAKSTLPKGYLRPDLDLSSHKAKVEWDKRFQFDHAAQIKNFQSRHSTKSTVVYSSEHLQSRLYNEKEIGNICDLLGDFYDKIDVLMYIRRQDLYAISAYNTSLRGGNTKHFSFDTINPEGHYYNYLKVIKMWANVFGNASINIRIFEKSKLFRGNIVYDLMKFIDDTFMPDKSITLPNENTALSATAQVILRSFNRFVNDECLYDQNQIQSLRSYVLTEVQKIDEGNLTLPSKNAARAFFQKFESQNREISERWLQGDCFSEDFDIYPAQELDFVDSDLACQHAFSLITAFLTQNKLTSSHESKFAA